MSTSTLTALTSIRAKKINYGSYKIAWARILPQTGEKLYTAATLQEGPLSCRKLVHPYQTPRASKWPGAIGIYTAVLSAA